MDHHHHAHPSSPNNQHLPPPPPAAAAAAAHPAPPPTLQPSPFANPPLPASTSQTQPPLPPLPAPFYVQKSSPREPSHSKYYDPTQDSAEPVARRHPPARYDPYPADSHQHSSPSHGRDHAAYPDARPPPAQHYDQSYQSPPNQNYPRPSPIHSQTFGNRMENMPASPMSPTHGSVYSPVPREPPSQAFSSPTRPVSRETPARKADPMSLSSIMSGNDDPPAYPPPHSRGGSKSSHAQPSINDAPQSPVQPPVVHNDYTPLTPKMVDGPIINGNGTKSEVNGFSSTTYRPPPQDVAKALERIDAVGLKHAQLHDFLQFAEDYKLRCSKRKALIYGDEIKKRKRRCLYYVTRAAEIFEAQADLGHEEYTKAHEARAWREVQTLEAQAEKERKKDLQRKRRREKALQAENQKREEAMERAENAADGEERDKAMREVERHSKKIRQTTKLLTGVDDKDLREVTPQNINLDGGIMGSFQTSEDGGRESKKGRGSRMMTRPKKSKEQKQAEKDAAAAAQAALERGETLPSIAPREAARLEKLEKTDRKDKDDVRSARDKEQRYTSKAYNQLLDSIWKDMSKRDVNKVLRLKNESMNTKQSNLRKTAQLAGKEARRFQLRTNKSTKDVQARAKRSMREMLTFWKKNERDERDQRKAVERQELENAKRLEAEREAARQRRKLNFLISQTELYSHFIGKKVRTGELERSTDDATLAANGAPPAGPDVDVSMPDTVGRRVTDFDQLDFDDEDESALKAAAMANAQHAIQDAQDRAREFDQDMDDGEMNFMNPTSLGDVNISQPELLNCQLKEYQLKGLNWLVNLYEQGINGILADEMGLGKTVQSISVLSYLAEHHNIWGPFLVVAPSSTLHNWQQEIARFVPRFKILPYWGTAKDRKVLRKFWVRKKLNYREDSPFHVLITSYQMVVQDTLYFQRMKWQYMILDEAQAIKSSQSSRWKVLLGFHCRNRLLLTGTPIQNNMQELWALLHFIMPTLFDNHEEFSEWFSKDIESHAQSNTKLNEDQLRRLHMILKPFMLRRIKKHVQKELGEKIELDVFCNLTYRQRAYYTSLRNKISLMDLIEKTMGGDDQDAATLMNLVMQFRKVCNHPDLFERADTSSPFSFGYWAETASFVREGHNVDVVYSARNLIEYKVPRMVYRGTGRLDLPGPDNETAGWRGKALTHMLNIFNPDYVADSAKNDGGFSWLRFADVSAGEVSQISEQDIFSRAVELRKKSRELGRFNVAYDGDDENTYVPAHSLFNIVERSQRMPLAEVCPTGHMANLLNVSANAFEQSGLDIFEPAARPSATAPPVALDCADLSAQLETQNTLFNVKMRTALYGITPGLEDALVEKKIPLDQYPVIYNMLPEPTRPKERFTHITVPSMTRFVSDCGKLARLDALLKELKEGGHRVLLYFQMTRMIDMMEEYLTYRNYKYCRLDGSTKIEDRRDTVHDFQTKPDIFIFLLSTRAGGLGINLTSADTVIFYDSDWNPTIDSQAMDRAHRLGQTRQVTVYRLITRGTIEERIRKRALQKEEVQRVVISGQTTSATGGQIDFNPRSRENRTKDIALWLADDDQAEEIERREQEALAKGEALGQSKGRKKSAKKSNFPESMEEMYHEGEGKFEDSAKPSGAATPVEGVPPTGKRKRVSKKAKTAAQRLAIADGEVFA